MLLSSETEQVMQGFEPFIELVDVNDATGDKKVFTMTWNGLEVREEFQICLRSRAFQNLGSQTLNDLPYSSVVEL